MRWWHAWRALARRGILAINRRNADCILHQNPRSLYPMVDDKLRMHDLCRRIGVPTPTHFAVVECHGQLRHLAAIAAEVGEFVIKPNHGSAGRGILVIAGREGDAFLRPDGTRVDADGLRHHASEILSGMYSLGGRPDQAIVQYRIGLHPSFADLAVQGIPDVRIIVYRYEPAMAMLRLPTRASGGRANLHQGGLGAGIDLASGRTHHAVHHDRFVQTHPDTGASVIDRDIPDWSQLLDIARKAARAIGLGFVGVDLVHDAKNGPMLLEANARPGLSIQIANGRGLLPRLAEIDETIRMRASSPKPRRASALI